MKLSSWLGVLLISALLIGGLTLATARVIPEATVHTGDVRFDTDSSMHYLTELTTRFPRRDYAHPQRLEAAEWIEQELKATGLTVYTQEFSEVIAGKNITGLRNVYAVLPGELEEAVMVVGHYDIPPYVEQGAADDASGVATVMELARVFAAEGTPRRTMIFLASDSEEYGAMWGSFQFLEQSGWKERLVAVISLDYVNMGEMKGIKVRSMGIQQGYAPLWLRQMSLAAVAQETTAIDVDTVMEWVERSVVVAPTEHGVYLRTGIPAIDLWGAPKDQPWQSAIYHTPGDTLDKIRPESMGNYGRTTERVLRSIQSLETIPNGEMFYLKTGNKYIPGWSLRIIQFLALLPLLAGVLAAWNAAGKGRISDIWNEVRHIGALFGAGALGYLVLWLSSETGLMTKYEMYPATQKDPILDNPEYLPLILTIAAFVIGYLLLRRLLKTGPATNPAVGNAMAMSGMLALLLAAITLNAGFAGLAFLAPAILFWPLVKPETATGRRIINLLLALSAVAVFAVFMVLFRQMYFIGHVWWYMMMCSAYGLFRARAVLSFVLAVALAVRFTIAAVAAKPAQRRKSRIAAGV